ncbi:putative membrane protein [Zancudomyces culisetae]|uniref:Putative membrane protein n=1 Tax=Zancudomyces culisetae TaxID=1213189 RepID=A0A1R1PR87_ZANCU|nr:putative membrane protein [Zancudomyces culisetae]|eukprot:OMH83459.1 putative membrane protein [Zancudomyces culisetae]
MKSIVLVLLTLVTNISAIALTKWVRASGEECLFTWNDQPGQKMSLYFAVQEGGNFDVDYTIKSPTDKIAALGQAKRQEDIVFTANEVGEYKFCFSNVMSTVADKLVTFDISVEDEARDPDLSSRIVKPQLDFGASKMFGDLHNIERLQLYFRARESRNFDTVRSTEQRVLWYALLESLCVVVVAIVQVYAIQALFTAKKTRF